MVKGKVMPNIGFKANFSSFIRNCDFIGIEPKLNFSMNSRNITVWGGLLCIAIYILMIIGTLYFGQEFPNRYKPNIVQKQEINTGDTPLTYGDNSFLTLYKFVDSNNNPVDITNYLDIAIKLKHYTRGGSTSIDDEVSKFPVNFNEEVISVKKCDFKNYPIFKGSILSTIRETNWNCLDANGIQLSGTSLSSEFHYLQYSVNRCVGRTTCASDADIEATVNNKIYLVIKYVNNIFNERNFNEVGTKYLEEYKVKLNTSQQKETRFTLTVQNYMTDTGYILEDFWFTNYFNIDSIQEEANFVVNSNNLSSVIFKQAKFNKTFYRKYYKVQNLLAEMGGLLKSFVLLALMLNYLHDNAKYYEQMLNELFDADDLHKYFQYYNSNNKSIFKKYRDSILLKNTKNFDFVKTNKDKNAINVGGSTVIGVKNNFFIENFSRANSKNIPLRNRSNTHTTPTPNNQVKTILGEEESKHLHHPEQYIYNQQNNLSEDEQLNIDYVEKLRKDIHVRDHFDKVKARKVKLNAWELFKFKFCKKKVEGNSMKKLILDSGKEIIDQRTNIIYIIKKMLEFDRFKNLILTSNQMTLLDALSKFMLDPERINLIDFERCTYDKLLDAYAISMNSNEVLDINLCNWVKTKFHLELEHSDL
jgi:hypothetical protein